MSSRTLEFGPLRIAYDDRVLEPRPWTFAQSRWAADLLADAPPGPILELCSGAGQIGLAAALLSGRDIVLVDASEAACEISVRNAADAGLGGRVEVRHGPMDAVLGDDERFALVLADPPYIPSGETDSFGDDPPPAIDGGPDGLEVIRTCMEVAARHLHPNGAVLMQTRGLAQARAVSKEERTDLRLCDVRAYDHERAVALFMKVGD